MKKLLKSFTLIEMLVVIAIIGILAALLSGPLMKARRTAQMTKCVNNLKQIGSALLLYEDKFQDNPPVAPGATDAGGPNDSATQTAANLLTLFSTELQDNIQGFLCPFTTATMKSNAVGVTPSSAQVTNGISLNATFTAAATKYTDYNLTAGYAGRSAARPNQIIAADSPFLSRSATGGSIHDKVDAVTDGAVCLYTDGHTAKEVNITDTTAPDGSSNKELTTGTYASKIGIYAVKPSSSSDAKIHSYIQATGAGVSQTAVAE